MKKILPFIILLFLWSGIAQAQRTRGADDMLDKQVLLVELTGPQMAMLELQRELKLTEEQVLQLEKLNEDRYQHMTEAESSYDDPLQLQLKFREIHVALDKVMASILTEQQLKHYLELEGRQHVQYLSGMEGEE